MLPGNVTRISLISGLVTTSHAYPLRNCRQPVAVRQCAQLVIVIGDFHERARSRARLITYH